jgi:hypothetical protein
MEFEIRGKNRQAARKIVRYLTIVFMVLLMMFFITKFKNINQFLLDISRNNELMPIKWWAVLVKFLLYGMHILLNFGILLAITKRLSYSLNLIYIAVFVLIIGMVLVFARDVIGVDVPITLLTLFVKINKSPILLVFFVAGHIVRERWNLSQQSKS